jgi:serine/threonine protein kinase
MEQYFNAGFEVCLHGNYEFSTASPIPQISTKAPNIKTISGLLALAQELNLQVLSESENARTERVGVMAGASSRVSILKLKRDIVVTPLVSQASSKGQLVISKHIPKGEIDDESKRYEALIRELLVISHPPIVSHPNIVNLLAIGWEDTEDRTMHKIWPTTILEYAEYGSLEDFFDLEDTDTSWDVKLSICRDIATGLNWLHRCSIVHSDLKLLNILIARADSGAATPYQAKICDFGYALDLDVLAASGSNTVTLEGYSPPWCAPEYASEIELPLLPRVDVCGFGLLACRIFMNGADPFHVSYRPATMQPTDHYTRHIKTWWASDQVTFLLKHACQVIGLFTFEQLNMIHSVLEQTTCLEAKNRVAMSDVCNILRAKTAEERYALR